LIVAPGETAALDIKFDLRDEVKKTFQQPAELRVHYRNGEKEEIVQAKLVGGPRR
jgi:hypothetical protein